MSEEVYKKLKQLRKERGLTLNNLAENVGLDYQQISRIERGKSRLTIDVLMKMARALNTPVETLIEPSGQKDKESPAKVNSPIPSQDLLTLSLQGIETLQSDYQFKISPGTKASLATQIYSQAQNVFIETHDFELAEKTLNASLSVLKTLLTA